MRFVVVSIALSLSAVPIADDKVQHDPRSAIEAYLAAALTGKVDDAVALALENRAASDEDQLHELNTFIEAPTLKVPAVWVGAKNGRAIAVSEQIQITEADPDGRNTGYLVFSLVKSKNKWLVDDIDFDTRREKRGTN